MTVTNIVECNKCHSEVNPPANAGWGRLCITGKDGVTITDVIADLCTKCVLAIMREINRPPLVS